MRKNFFKLKDFYKNNKKAFYFGFFILALLLIVVINKKDSGDSIIGFVDRGNVQSLVNLSGRVESVNFVDLRFANSGSVSNIYFKEGEEVRAGQKIAELDNRALLADLKDAQANLILRNAGANTTTANTLIAEENLRRVTEQQNLLVLNSLRRLLNNDLAVYPTDLALDYSVTPPTVSGSYIGDKEGFYEIEVFASSSSSGFSFRYKTNIEEDGIETINRFSPSKLGTRGLYLNFSEGQNYANTKWIIEVPNKRSSSYFSVLNGYNEALKARDFLIKDAEDGLTRARLSQGGDNRDVINAEILQARARIDRIDAQIRDGIIVAPFDGVISRVNIKSGEFASANTVAVSLISPEGFQIRLEVPEVDLVKISEGAPVQIELDAFPGVFFDGVVGYVAPSETLVNGVSVYETIINFLNSDERVRSGMNARVVILEDMREDVLFIKRQFIERDEMGEYVHVLRGDSLIKTYIKTGLFGTNGDVEILAGLSFGDNIIINTR